MMRSIWRRILAGRYRPYLMSSLLTLGSLLLTLSVFFSLRSNEERLSPLHTAKEFYFANSFAFLLTGLIATIALAAYLIFLVNRSNNDRKHLAQQTQALRDAQECLEQNVRQRTLELQEELAARRTAERELEKQRVFLRQVIDLNPNFVFAKDRSGRFTLVNKSVAQAYGTTIAELTGKCDADFNSNEEEVEHFRKDDLYVLDTLQELVIQEEVLTDAEGNTRWLHTVKRPIIDEHGVANHILGVASDITARKEAETRVSVLAAIVACSDDAIISTDLNRTITSWNRGAERLFGFSQEEAIGRAADIMVPEERLDELKRNFSLLEQGSRIENFETVRMRKDGTQIDVSLTVSPITDEEGVVTGVAGIARDITQRRETEKELSNYRKHLEQVIAERTRRLSESQEQLRQSERMASIGALAAGIAHEINNPVGVMLLSAQNALEAKSAVQSEDELNSILDRTCKKIITNAKRCGLIVKGVLQFAREDKTEKWPSDISEIIHSALQLVHELLNLRNTSIIVNVEPRLPEVKVNALEIEQALVNLVKNALDSGDANNVITVSAKSERNGVTLSVSDRGFGIDPEHQKHIFDPFFTTRLRTGGTGLGLSIVHGIVRNHRGSISLESEVGKGTSISLFLPLDPDIVDTGDEELLANS